MRSILLLVLSFDLIATVSVAAVWPDCRVRSGMRGSPAIVIDGTPFAPLMFMGNNQFGRDDVLVEEIRKAAQAGIHLISFNVFLDWHRSSEQSAQTVARFCSADPDSYFYVRIWLGPDQAWVDAHPDECVTKADGSRQSYASPSSVIWRDTASRMLRKRVRELVEGPYGSRFIGVVPTYLQTGEWFYQDTNDFMDYSAANLNAFRRWLKATYGSEFHLRKAWADPEVTFDTAGFPPPEVRDAAAWGPFRDPAKHRCAMNMQRFQDDLIAETIAYFASVVKDATEGRSLVGVFYGYAMELNDNGARALAHSGHLALAQVLACPDVDIIHAPYSYFERKVGQPGHLHLPADSIALHGKLGIFEEDTYTHLSDRPPKGLPAPGWPDRTGDLAETLAVDRRNFANFFTHRCGMWIFDLLSDGRWNNTQFWDSAALLRRLAAELRTEGLFTPEIAFVVDEGSVHVLRANTWPLLLHSLSFWRAEWDRVGAPVGYYLQTDLARLPDSVKVLVMANAYVLGKEQRRAVERHLKGGGTVIWTYAPDIFGPEGVEAARVGRVTGLQVEPRFDAEPMTIVCEPMGEIQTISREGWSPRFVVTSDGVEVLARYQSTNEVCAAVAPVAGGVSIYTAVPRLPVGLLRSICRRSGVHLYRDSPGMTGVLGPYLVVHTEDTGPQGFMWSGPCCYVRRVVPYASSSCQLDGEGRWEDSLPGGVTAIYRCE